MRYEHGLASDNKSILKCIIYGSRITLLASLASDKYGVEPIRNSSLVGLFGSNNVVSLFTSFSQ